MTHRAAKGGVSAVLVVLLCFSCTDSEEPAGPSASGRVIWKASGFLASGRPGVDGFGVYAMDTGRVVRAFRRADGALLWQRTVPKGENAFIEDVVVRNGVVVIPQSDLIGLDAQTGSTKWTFSHPSRPGSLWLGTDDSTIYAGAYRGRGELFAVRFADGTARWTNNIVPSDFVLAPADDVRIVGPVFDHGVVFTSFVQLRPSQVFHSRGGVAAVNAQTGAVIWSRMLPATDPSLNTFPSPPAATAGLVVVGTEDGFAYALDRANGEIRWTVPPASASGAATADVRMVGADDLHVVVTSSVLSYDLASFALADGKEVWHRNTTLGSVFTPLLVDHGIIYSHHGLGQLAATDVANGEIKWTLVDDVAGFFASRLSGDTLYAVGTGVWAIRAR